LEEGPKEIERPDTPVGFEVANTQTRTTNKPNTKKAKQSVAQEIHYPTVETPAAAPPTQTKATKAKAKTTTTTTTTQPRNGSPQTQTKNQTKKRKQNRIELEIVVRDLVNHAEAVIGVVDSNKNFIIKDEEAAAYYNVAQYF